MLKRLRKRLRQRRLATAIALTLAFAVPAAPACADIGAQVFSDGAPHTVTDNIVAPVMGLDVSNPGTSATMTGHSITADWGVNAWDGGRVTLNNVAVIARNGCGLTSWSSSVITMTGGSIISSGGGGNSGVAESNGTIILNGVTIISTGSDQYGALTLPGGGTISITGGSITTTGNDSYGLMTNGGGPITMTGGSVTTTGANSHGVWGYGITLTNVAITTTGANSYALYGRGGPINATVSGQSISGAGALIYADTGSTINLSATGTSRLYGTTAMNGGGIANLTLGDSAVWMVPGNSALTTLALSGGTVSFTAPSAGVYKNLGVAGTLSGRGGAFILNANLVNGQNDLVNVSGAASGSHQVFVLGQRSAVNLYQTAKVVDLVNEAVPHTATFSGGGDIGAYRYAIAKGSDVPAGYSGVGSLVDIYLYNTFAPSTPARAAASTAASPGVLWYGEMNDIKKRLGELRLGATTDSFWARTYAGKYTVKPTGGQSFDQIMRGLEIGSDKPSDIKGGKRYLGWVAGVGRADNTFAAGGNGASDSFYLGAYGSWLKDDGSYLDIVGKHNWFRHSFSAPLLGGGSDSAAYNTNGFGLSVETGKRIERGNGVFVEPQVELAALWSEGKNYFTSNGLYVSAPATTSLQLRLGAAFGKKTAITGGGSRQVYGKLSWVEELAGRSRTTVDTLSVDSSLKGGRLVLGLGFMEDTAKRQLYLDFETATGKTTSKPWGVNLGCRWKL